MRRFALLLATVLSIVAATPALADENTDAIMLFGMMLAPLVADNNAPHHPQGPVRQAPANAAPMGQPSEPPAFAGNDVLTAGGLPVDHHSPAVRGWLTGLADALAVLIGLLGVAMIVGMVLATVHQNRRIAQARADGRRIVFR